MTCAAPASSLSQSRTVGFVGLGAMGFAMATRLLDAGHHVAVWNRDQAKAVRLGAMGAQVCASPAAVALAADAVFGCLLDTEAVHAVYGATGGLLEASRPGQIFVEHATFSPAAARLLADDARARGVHFLDAPVTGGPEGAAAGTLTAMVGGDAEALDRVGSVMAAYTDQVTHVGGVGAGLALKLCNQLLVSCHLAAAAEASALIERLGLDPGISQQVLSSGWAASAMLSRVLPRAAAHDYTSAGATIGGLVAGQQLIGELAQSFRLELTTFAAAAAACDRAMEAGWRDSDPAALAAMALSATGAAGLQPQRRATGPA